jgi:prepilin-type processing-associated H-X9-DG protein
MALAKMLIISPLRKSAINQFMDVCCNFRPGGNWTNWRHGRSFKSMHSGGVNAALADGSVRFISEGIASTTFQQLGTIAGGETFTLD